MRDQQVKNAFLPQDIAVYTVVFAAGAACFLLGEGWGGLGVTIILCGIMVVLFYHHGYRLKGRKGLFRLTEISLSRENRDEILAFLDRKTDSLDLHPWQKGGALVDVYTRVNDGFMMARYFDCADFLKGIEYPLKEVSPEQVSVLEASAIDRK